MTAPANDNFADAQVVTGNSGTVTGTNVDATFEAGEPDQQHGDGEVSIWYSWTPAAGGSAQIDTIGSAIDTVLCVYTGPDLADLVLAASDDDSGGSATSKITIDVVGATTYWIRVNGYDSSEQGDVTLHWAWTAPPPAPANDNFAAAITLSGDTGTVTGYNTSATLETGEPDPPTPYTGDKSVWWKWTAPTVGILDVSLSGTAFSAVLDVFTG